MDTGARKVSLENSQTNTTLLFIPDNKRKCWTIETMFDENQTSFNITQHRATCWIQQCWKILHQHVTSIWQGL